MLSNASGPSANSSYSKRDSKPQTDSTPTVNALLRKGREKTCKVRVRVKAELTDWITAISTALQHRLQRTGIDLDIETSEVGKTAIPEILVGHPDRMIEKVVDISAQARGYPLAEPEILV